mgnify:CR=1 FL=1
MKTYDICANATICAIRQSKLSKNYGRIFKKLWKNCGRIAEEVRKCLGTAAEKLSSEKTHIILDDKVMIQF